ncbi:hypothetical protein NKH16_23815 [Mesorhizobium sp. M1307]|uniref:hypothetical protein n=1 Tax=Mesorhizobium sp. M1307 TaxID=2957079 RepID=UPI003338BEDB
MWIELETFPSLDTPEIRDWVLHKSAPFPGPVPPGKPDQTRELGAPTMDTDKKPIKAFGYQREYYNLFERNKFLKSISVLVITEQNVLVRILSNLFIGATVDQTKRDKITRFFMDYDQAKHGDPIVYAAAMMPPDITPDMFSVLPSYVIEKVGNARNHNEERDALFKFFSGRGAEMIPFNGGDFERYIEQGHFSLKLTKIEDVDGPPPVSSNPRNAEGDADNPDSIIGPILNEDAKGMTCEPNRTEKERILTVLWWPEFMTKLKNVTIDLGCGVHIVISVPVLCYRDGKEAMWVALAHPAEFDQLLVRQLVDCLIRAAVAGVVVGVVTYNFEAALAAFVGVFRAQLLIYVGHDVDCVIPELFLITEHGTWKEKL